MASFSFLCIGTFGLCFHHLSLLPFRVSYSARHRHQQSTMKPGLGTSGEAVSCMYYRVASFTTAGGQAVHVRDFRGYVFHTTGVPQRERVRKRHKRLDIWSSSQRAGWISQYPSFMQYTPQSCIFLISFVCWYLGIGSILQGAVMARCITLNLASLFFFFLLPV